MNLSRTDLAVETAEALPTGRDMFAPGTGVTKSECLLCGCPVTRIHVHTPAGARAIGKPEGRYITIDLRPALSRQEALTGRAALCLCRELRALLPPPSDGPALVVGLGNDAMTPDAVGAAALEHLLVTRHMVRSMPRQFGALTPVAALATGVLARTGVETLELIRGAADRLHPSVVIAIDALAARSRHRLCATVQLGDTGLIPGSGVGNHRKAVNARTLGVPVIGIGVPTVVGAGTIVHDAVAGVLESLEESEMDEFLGEVISPALESLYVTTKEIDEMVRRLAGVLAAGMNQAFSGEL